MEIIRMWEGGPLREFSQERFGNAIPYSSPILAGFAGRYVCDGCQEPASGIYSQKGGYRWLCGACREASRPRRPIPAGLLRYQERALDKDHLLGVLPALAATLPSAMKGK